MQYILTGFSHDMGFRVFEFECIGEDRVRTGFKVRADLALIAKYGIRVQELPLLCRGILERRDEGGEQLTLTYTESDMRLHADVCAAQAAVAQKRKVPRRPPSDNVGTAWRGTRV
jgi:hypothetical protein